MGYETYRIADLIDEIAMGPFGSNIKVSCFVDKGKKLTLLTRQMHIAGIL